MSKKDWHEIWGLAPLILFFFSSYASKPWVCIVLTSSVYSKMGNATDTLPRERWLQKSKLVYLCFHTKNRNQNFKIWISQWCFYIGTECVWQPVSSSKDQVSCSLGFLIRSPRIVKTHLIIVPMVKNALKMAENIELNASLEGWLHER